MRLAAAKLAESTPTPGSHTATGGGIINAPVQTQQFNPVNSPHFHLHMDGRTIPTHVPVPTMSSPGTATPTPQKQVLFGPTPARNCTSSERTCAWQSRRRTMSSCMTMLTTLTQQFRTCVSSAPRWQTMRAYCHLMTRCEYDYTVVNISVVFVPLTCIGSRISCSCLLSTVC